MNRRRRRRGAAMMELAISLVVLLTLTFGLLEYGLLFWRMHHVTNAARAGARTAVRPDATIAQIDDAINKAMQDGGFATGSFVRTITPSDPTTLEVGQSVSVRIVVDYSELDLTLAFVPTPATIEADVTMAKEGP